MASLLQDLRHTLRQLARHPIFTATAVLTLAIGMGVNAVAFSVVNGLFLKGPAGGARDGVGRIATAPQDDPDRNASLPEFERFRAATAGAATVAAEGRSALAWQHDQGTDTAWVLFVSADYFTMVAPPVRLGQLHLARRGADAPVVMVGERFWRERLASRSIAGLMLRLNHVDVSVAGVIAESFTGPAGIYSPDIWLPLEDLAAFTTAPRLQRRDTRWLFVLAKPDADATGAEVQAHIDRAVAEMARDWPDTHRGHPARFRAIDEGGGERQGLATAAAVGMGIIGLVLLLACFNVANLLLARAVERERDMGIRTALGARPGRLMRLVVTEGLVIAVASGAVALLIAWWTQSLMGTFAIPIEQPQHIDLTPDGTVVWFLAGLIVVAGVLPGVWPAIAAARVDVLRVLGSQGANTVGARPAPLRRWLVGAQVAGSTLFLAMSALLVQSYARILDTDVGFARDRLVLVELQPAQYGYDRDRATRYVAAADEAIRGLPGVADVALAHRAPFFIGYDTMTPVWPATGACEGGGCPSFPTYAVSPGYLRVMGIGLTEGREFTSGGDAAEVIVNGTFADAQWPGTSALGQVLRIGAEGRAVTVVGVTALAHTRGLDRERAALFVPLTAAHYDDALTVVVRTAGDPVPLVRPVAEAVRAIDPEMALPPVKTMAQRMAVQMWPFRTLSLMFTICGGLALVIATVGLAAVVIHSVSRRTREFGVRLSVGATPRDLVREVLGDSARLLAPGLLAGLVLAAGAARLAQAIFVGVNVLNPLTYFAVAVLHAAIVAIACVGPAVRASRLDPIAALRSE
ncbi:MAG: ABC transporter permease [Vicinamibacterales bacterium]|nr:ABC transporter permease [Vicinamibacterales bacterium]